MDSASSGKRIQGKGGGESLQSMKELFRQNVVNESASRSVSAAGAGMEDQEQQAQYSNHHHHKYCPVSKRMAAAGVSPKKGAAKDSLSCANDIAGFELVLEKRDS